MSWDARIADRATAMRANRGVSEPKKSRGKPIPRPDLCLCGTCRQCAHREFMRTWRIRQQRFESPRIERRYDELYRIIRRMMPRSSLSLWT